jgi:hypothetical protein
MSAAKDAEGFAGLGDLEAMDGRGEGLAGAIMGLAIEEPGWSAMLDPEAGMRDRRVSGKEYGVTPAKSTRGDTAPPSSSGSSERLA